MSERLKIALQKSGRLSDECQDLLEQCGVKAHWSDRRLVVYAKNMPIELLRVRDDDIPGLVFDGVVDLGFVGENTLEEAQLARQSVGEAADCQKLTALEFGECRLSIAVPKAMDYQGAQSLEGLRIATSYPHLLKRHMQARAVAYKNCFLAGSVEVAPSAGVAAAICDLVSSGATLDANGLKEVEVVYRSKACLIQKTAPVDAKKRRLIDKLLSRILGVQQAAESKYIMLHAPKDNLAAVLDLLPAKNPTVLPLAGAEDKLAVHAVSQETLFWETMEAIKAAGGESILVLPIEKMLK